MKPTTAAWLAYLTFIPAIIFLVMDPYKRDNFIKFHCIQCLVLTGVSLAANILFGIVASMGMWSLSIGLQSLFSLALFIFVIVAMIKAARGERYHIPLLGDLAENFAKQ